MKKCLIFTVGISACLTNATLDTPVTDIVVTQRNQKIVRPLADNGRSFVVVAR